MSNITITLTPTQIKGFEYVGADPQEWAENAVFNRARQAVDEIVQIAVAKCLENGVQIPGSKEDIVALAFQNSWVKTAAERQAEFEAEYAARLAAQAEASQQEG